MARASTVTWLPLDRYAQIMGIHPMHFNQCYHATLAPIGNCNNIFYQYSWQNGDAVGREDLAQAIHEAERRIADYLGYPLIPDWVTDERRNVVKPYRPELRNPDGVNLTGFNKSVPARWGWVRSGGVRASSLYATATYNVIGANGFSYGDYDGDGFAESVVLYVNTPSFDVCELRVYQAETFPNVTAYLPENEIRPFDSITSSGGLTAIKFKKWQTLIYKHGIELSPNAIDITATVDEFAANLFAQELGVYRVRNDPQTQVSFLWELPQCSTCGGSGCTACQLGTQTGCLTVRDMRRGFVTYEPATWDAANSEFDAAAYAESREPDRLRLYYQAGWRDESRACPDTQMDPVLERAVAYFATALMDRELCGCGNVAQFAKHWRDDLAMGNAGRSYQNGGRVLDNPFGTTRGAVYAWDVCNQDGRRIVREQT